MIVWHADSPLRPFKKRLAPGWEECSLRVLKICLSFQTWACYSQGGHQPITEQGTSPAISVQYGALWQAILALEFPSGLAGTLIGITVWQLPLCHLTTTLSFHGCYSQWNFHTPTSVSLSASQVPNLQQGTGVRGKVASCSITDSGDPNKWKLPKRTELRRIRPHPAGEIWLDSLMNSREIPPRMGSLKNKSKFSGVWEIQNNKTEKWVNTFFY